MGQRTVLFANHQKAQAKIVDFSGWDMPLHYGSQIEEHHRVRDSAGVFDVSHMRVVDISGADAEAFLKHLLANDVTKLKSTGRALYTAMLNQQGGILDDLIVYRISDGYRIVVNCGTAEKDLAWIHSQSGPDSVAIRPREDLSIIAVQGPHAIGICHKVLSKDRAEGMQSLKPFSAVMIDDWFIARTGYTGENGLEIILPNDRAVEFWDKLLDQGVHPAGLAARDTLRLEAGLNLYGSDMDESVNPLESNLDWTLSMTADKRDFIGRSALEEFTGKRRLVGLIMTQRGVMRAHQVIYSGDQVLGEITSGAHSPTLGHSIAFARLDFSAGPGDLDSLTVEIRNRRIPVRLVQTPFVRHGKKVYEAYRQEE